MSRRGQMIPRGDRKWLLRVYLGRNAQGKKKYSGEMFEGTTSQASQQLTKLLRDSDTDVLVRPTKHTFAEYVEEWYKTKVQVSKATLNSYKQHLNLYIIPYLGHLRLHQITTLVVQDAITTLRDRGLAPRTIEYAHTVLHQTLQKAVKLGFLVRNPTEDTELPAKVKRPFTILSLEQMETLFDSEKKKRLLPLWMLLLDTGLRPGEATALKWLDLDGETIRIQRVLARTEDGSYQVLDNKAKTEGSLRAVTLTKSLIEALKEHRTRQVSEMLKAGERYARNDFIFATHTGAFLDPTNVRRDFKRALKRAKLPEAVRLYDTRHSHATALLNAGVNLAWVSARLGHTSVRTTEACYTRVLPEAHRQMADTLEQLHQKAKLKKAAQA